VHSWGMHVCYCGCYRLGHCFHLQCTSPHERAFAFVVCVVCVSDGEGGGGEGGGSLGQRNFSLMCVRLCIRPFGKIHRAGDD